MWVRHRYAHFLTPIFKWKNVFYIRVFSIFLLFCLPIIESIYKYDHQIIHIIYRTMSAAPSTNRWITSTALWKKNRCGQSPLPRRLQRPVRCRIAGPHEHSARRPFRRRQFYNPTRRRRQRHALSRRPNLGWDRRNSIQNLRRHQFPAGSCARSAGAGHLLSNHRRASGVSAEPPQSSHPAVLRNRLIAGVNLSPIP